MTIEAMNAPDAGSVDFWAPHSLEELARRQCVEPLQDIDNLAGGFPDGEDIDYVLDDIYRHRETA